jgi:hypothetical protein
MKKDIDRFVLTTSLSMTCFFFKFANDVDEKEG